jgi:predicted dehydrogenase
MKALLIGCGNIGGGYDLTDPGKVWTHAKAYTVSKIDLTVFDQDTTKSQQLVDKYNARLLHDLTDEDYRSYDIISITTPTTTHFHLLEKALKASVPVVICEKPLVSDTEQAIELGHLYTSSHSKILVNYIRPLQPGYIKAKKTILNLHREQGLRSIITKYKRGFLNNASHAIDLLQFIFEARFDFKNFQCTTCEFDAFNYDPTLTASCVYLECPVSFAGVADTTYPIFEIELFFSSSKVVICHGGNEIRYYHDDNGAWNEHFDERQTALLDTYMLPVIDAAIDLYNGTREDNFITSLHLNKAILEIIEPLKEKSNATVSN